MSSTAIDYRAPTAVRTTAQRVADGVVAGYIRALATASGDPSDDQPPRKSPMRECEQGRTVRSGYASAVGARRQLARQRALLPA